MAESNADKLRMALYRLDSNPNVPYDGTGLALPTALGVKITRDEARSILADLERGERVEAAVVDALGRLRDAPELNPRNFDEDDALRLNDAVGDVFMDLEAALGGGE